MYLCLGDIFCFALGRPNTQSGNIKSAIDCLTDGSFLTLVHRLFALIRVIACCRKLLESSSVSITNTLLVKNAQLLRYYCILLCILYITAHTACCFCLNLIVNRQDKRGVKIAKVLHVIHQQHIVKINDSKNIDMILFFII